MLVKLKGILELARRKTAPAWPELREAYQWIHQGAQILENEAELPQYQVEKSFQDLMESMSARDAEGQVALQKPLNTFSRLLEVIGLVYFTAIRLTVFPELIMIWSTYLVLFVIINDDVPVRRNLPPLFWCVVLAV